jgi:predicted DNA-binding protein (MmcQ/YjbR family)
MTIDWLRDFCLSLPHTTEQIQWGDNLVFKVAGKMYAVAALEPAAHWLSLKCSDEDFARLIERSGIDPAPYLARAHWVAIETEDTLPRGEMQQLLSRAHALVFAKLPKKTQAALTAPKSSTNRQKSTRRARRKAGRVS